MPTLTINKQYADNQILTEAQLDAAFASVSTLINTTGLGSDNIQDNSIGPAELQTSSVTETKIATDAVTTTKILDGSITQAKLASALQALLVPTGAVSPYAGDTAPSGWLLCDGTQVSRTTYATLFAKVGVRFGSGDGTTTFHLPDLRGRFVRGYDGTAGRDPDSASRTAMNTGGATGNNVGSVQDDQFKSHNHQQTNNTGSGGSELVGSSQTGSGQQPNGFTFNTGGNETRPKNATLNFIIKT